MCGSFGGCSWSCTDPGKNPAKKLHKCPAATAAAAATAVVISEEEGYAGGKAGKAGKAMSEDCLFLNVFVPSKSEPSNQVKRP